MWSGLISFERIKRFSRSSRVRQTSVMYISLVASLMLGIVSSIITTRLLGPQAFGDFKFLQVIWSVSMMFVTFGLFTTGGILITKKDTPESERSFMGSMLVIACVISVLFTVLMAFVSFPIGQLYGQDLGNRVWLYSMLMFVFPLQMYLQDALRGANDITSLALLNVLPQLIFILVAISVSYWLGFSLDAALLAYLIGIGVTVFVVVVRTKPSFRHARQGVQELMENNRAIGGHIYIAILITTATTQLSQFCLAYFFDTRLVGMFALAITITMPLTMIPNAISTTFFKHFATLDRIPRKVILATLAISAATLLVFLAAIREIILLLYSEKFIEVVPLAYICAVGAILHGIADVYNRYLLAHGETRVLRANAFHLGVISVLGYLFLVAWWGATGAAATKLLVDVVYLGSMLFYYGQRPKRLMKF